MTSSPASASSPADPSAAPAGPAVAAPERRFDWTLALLVVFCLLWSSAFAVSKIAVAEAPPLLLLATRFLAAGVAMLVPCALFGGLVRLPLRDFLALCLAGVLNNALYLGLAYCAVVTISSGFVAVIISANPLITALLAGPVLGERLKPMKVVGLLLGLAGVVIVLRSRLAGGHEDLFGTLLALGGLLALSCGTVLFKRLRTPASLFMASGVQSLAAGLSLMPVALMMEPVHAIEITPTLAACFAYLTLGVSVGGYSLWYAILSRSTATKASALHFLMPPLGLAFGWLLLGEAVPPLDFLGIIPIALGIRLVTR